MLLDNGDAATLHLFTFADGRTEQSRLMYSSCSSKPFPQQWQQQQL